MPTEQTTGGDGTEDPTPIESRRFRDVLGNFATGVTIVTADDGGEMVGMAANSFTSISIDPPLVGFCAAHSSTTYPRIRRAGHFCVNVLAEGQHDVARLFATPGADRFAEVSWRVSRLGGAILGGVLAFVGCTLEAEHVAGDHVIVVGRVVELEVDETRRPLLFFRGQFSVERPEIDFL